MIRKSLKTLTGVTAALFLALIWVGTASAHPDVILKDKTNTPIDAVYDSSGSLLTNTPYSPRYTCGSDATGCHGQAEFDQRSQGFHVQMGANQVLDNFVPPGQEGWTDPEGQKDFVTGPGMFGKW